MHMEDLTPIWFPQYRHFNECFPKILKWNLALICLLISHYQCIKRLCNGSILKDKLMIISIMPHECRNLVCIPRPWHIYYCLYLFFISWYTILGYNVTQNLALSYHEGTFFWDSNMVCKANILQKWLPIKIGVQFLAENEHTNHQHRLPKTF